MHLNIFSKVLSVSLTAISLAMTGCASRQPAASVQPTSPAPVAPSLQQLMQEAARAAGEGKNQERARDLYRTAARTYPASKEPWVKLAEDYFAAANYGQAILAAQEVVQRDPEDSVASSVLAVSGLRVSAAALATLREQNSKLVGSTRSEAQTLARMLRDALGEAELVPQNAAPGTGGTSSGGRTTARTRPAAAERPATAPAAAVPSASKSPPRPASAASAPRPAPAAPAADPFKIFRK